MILKCDCNHSFQNEKYGYGMRVHNPTVKENTYRCTICKQERGDSGVKKAEVKTEK